MRSVALSILVQLLPVASLVAAHIAGSRQAVHVAPHHATRCFRAASVTMQGGVSSGGAVLLQANELSQTFDGDRYQFRDASLSIARGAKTGLVGANGVGKSSLLRILAGVDEPEEGEVRLFGGACLAYVEQDPSLPPGTTADQFIFASPAPAMVALRRFRAAAAAAGGELGKQAVDATNRGIGAGRVDEADGKAGGTAREQAGEAAVVGYSAVEAELQAATAAMDAAFAWELEDEVTRLCETLSVNHLLQRDASELSGGERKRVALAAAMLSRADVLLLDEPTNHLDIAAVRWLERTLQETERTVLLVTHDRAFLNEVCDEIVELHSSCLFRHPGSYDKFLASQAARLEAEGQQAAAARNKWRSELAWVRKQPKARSTKSKSRLDAFEQLEARVAAAPKKAGEVKIDAEMGRLGSSILTFDDVGIEIDGRSLISGFSYEFSKGERIGVCGPNGAGKTTFLKALQGQLPLAQGVVNRGETLRFGYYEQDGRRLPAEQRMLDFIRDVVADTDTDATAEAQERTATALLRQFLFPPSRWAQPLAQLSGGERRRLQLLAILATKPNFLLLDEPTNDLDIDTMQVVEEFSASFGGVLVVVSHDRWFLDRTCDRLFLLPGDGSGDVRVWEGRFTDYLAWQDAEAAAAEEEEARVKEQQRVRSEAEVTAVEQVDGDGMPIETSSALRQKAQQLRPLSNFEVKEIARLETEIAKIEERRRTLQKQIDQYNPKKNDYSELTAWMTELEELADTLDTKEERWLALSERADL